MDLPILGQIFKFIDPVSQVIFFLVDITSIAYFYIMFVKKAKVLKDSPQMGPYLSKKLALC